MSADATAKPDVETLKRELRDIDLELVSPDGAKSKAGRGNRAEGEADWGQKSGGDKRDNNSGRGGGSGGRGRGRRGDDERGSEDRDNSDGRGSDTDDDNDVTCFCRGRRGHIRPNCPKRYESCRECDKIGHLRTMCKSTAKTGGGPSGGSPAPEAGQFEDLKVFACHATIGTMESFISEPAQNSNSVDMWLGDSGEMAHPAAILNDKELMVVDSVGPSTDDREIYEVVIDEWVIRYADAQEPMRKKELLIDMVEESDPEVELHDEDVLPPLVDVDAHDAGLLSAVDEDEVDRVAPASTKKVLIGKKEWKKAFQDNKFHSVADRLVGDEGLVTFVDVKMGSMGADMITKAVGPAVFAGNIKLIGIFKGG